MRITNESGSSRTDESPHSVRGTIGARSNLRDPKRRVDRLVGNGICGQYLGMPSVVENSLAGKVPDEVCQVAGGTQRRSAVGANPGGEREKLAHFLRRGVDMEEIHPGVAGGLEVHYDLVLESIQRCLPDIIRDLNGDRRHFLAPGRKLEGPSRVLGPAQDTIAVKHLVLRRNVDGRSDG